MLIALIAPSTPSTVPTVIVAIAPDPLPVKDLRGTSFISPVPG